MNLTGEQARPFDEWAPHYDAAVQEEKDFPSIGYSNVLGEIERLCAPRSGMVVVDMGTGTGELARRLSDGGCEVWGVDFSANMLAEARKKVPHARLLQADLNHGWPAALPIEVDSIVSSYALHHFPLTRKISLLLQWATHLVAGCSVVVGDIAFPTVDARTRAEHRWQDLWDSDEFYWAADETLPRLAKVGLEGTYTQISLCAGVFKIQCAVQR